MDALHSPKDGDNLGFGSGMAGELGGGASGIDEEIPNTDYLKVKVYFYTEDKQIRQRVFPEEYFIALEQEAGEDETIDRNEPPSFEVSRRNKMQWEKLTTFCLVLGG